MAAAIVTGDVQPLKRIQSLDIFPPSMHEMLVVLLGNSWSERSSVGNLLLGETKFNTEEEPDFVTVRGQIKEKEIVLINTPDLLNPNISEDKLRKHVELCVRLSDPGPHVFLLVLQPEDFTEEHRLRICRVLELFSDQSFDRSLVLISASREESSFENFMNNPSFRDLIRECRYRYLFQKNLERSELLIRFSQIVKENSREHLSSEDAGLTMKPTLSDVEFQQERIQKEEDEMKKEVENLSRKHQEDLQKIREQLELTEKQLKEKNECITKERELRKKEESQKQEWKKKAEAAEKKLQSERENAERKLELTRREMKKEREEDEKRQKKEESQKQEWKRKAESAENKFKSEREQRENTEKKLEQTRREMKKEINQQRDVWDKEKKEIYERMHQESREVLEEERIRNRKLQEELYGKRKKWMYCLFGLLSVISSSLFYLFLSGGLTPVTGSDAE